MLFYNVFKKIKFRFSCLKLQSFKLCRILCFLTFFKISRLRFYFRSIIVLTVVIRVLFSVFFSTKAIIVQLVNLSFNSLEISIIIGWCMWFLCIAAVFGYLNIFHFNVLFTICLYFFVSDCDRNLNVVIRSGDDKATNYLMFCVT